MTDEPTNLVLEHLRHIRQAVDRIEQDVADLKHRVSAQEEITGQILIMLARSDGGSTAQKSASRASNAASTSSKSDTEPTGT